MERYQPDQYGRMMPDAHGQWVSLRSAEITALDAAQKASADAQATVEALQRENACKDTLIETLQAQLAQRGKDVGNE